MAAEIYSWKIKDRIAYVIVPPNHKIRSIEIDENPPTITYNDGSKKEIASYENASGEMMICEKDVKPLLSVI